MIITISGKPGSGKSTVARILAKRLKYRHYSAGDIRRAVARKRGLTIEQLNKIGERRAWTDKLADDFTKKLAKKDRLVVDGRLAWYFMPDSLKIFLDVSEKAGAKRVLSANRSEEKLKDLKRAMRELKKRSQSDVRRYRKYYKIKNCYDGRHFDYVIDTTRMKPADVVKRIMKIAAKESNL